MGKTTALTEWAHLSMTMREGRREHGLCGIGPARWAEGEEESGNTALGCLLGYGSGSGGRRWAKREWACSQGGGAR